MGLFVQAAVIKEIRCIQDLFPAAGYAFGKLVIPRSHHLGDHTAGYIEGIAAPHLFQHLACAFCSACFPHRAGEQSAADDIAVVFGNGCSKRIQRFCILFLTQKNRAGQGIGRTSGFRFATGMKGHVQRFREHLQLQIGLGQIVHRPTIIYIEFQTFFQMIFGARILAGRQIQFAESGVTSGKVGIQVERFFIPLTRHVRAALFVRLHTAQPATGGRMIGRQRARIFRRRTFRQRQRIGETQQLGITAAHQ